MRHIIVIVLLLLIPSIYASSLLYRPTIYINPISTHAAVAGILVDEETAKNFLERIGLSIDDIILDSKYTYFIMPIMRYGYYINNTLYLKDNTSDLEKVSKYFNKLYREDPSRNDIFIVVKPINNTLIIIGTKDKLNLTCNPAICTRPRYILFKNNKLYRDFELVISVPQSITDLAHSIATFYIEISVTNEDYNKAKLEDMFKQEIKDTKQWIEENKDKPWILAEGPRKPPEIIYINDWPVILTPQHEICKISSNQPPGIECCIIYGTHSATGIRNIWIIIHSYLGDEAVIAQWKVILNKVK